MSITKLTTAVIAALSLPMLALSQEQDAKSLADGTWFDKEKMEFEQMDTNKDGAVSSEEAEEAELEGFSEADINLNEEISLHEYIYHVRTSKQAQ